LRLRGEALFTVTHHDKTPLTVLAGPSVTRVLGTQFVVRHYSGDTAARVVVQSGKVRVGPIVVTAREETTVSAAGVAPVRAADLTQLSFATGTLTIRDTPLRDAIADLNRWYDVDIRPANAALGAQRINGAFAAGSIANLASILELMLNVHAVHDGRVLTLFPK
jgi:transmembrane sensor